MSSNYNGPVLGIDASLTSTGVTVVAREGSIHYVGTLPALRKTKGVARLVSLRGELEQILREFDPSLAVLEDLPKQAMSAGLTGQAQGVVREVLTFWGVPIITTAPASLKKAATGSGRSDKDGMRECLPGKMGSHLRNDDEVDAYWLAQVGLEHKGMVSELVFPEGLNVKEVR